MIFFVTVTFAETVYVMGGGGGFTSLHMMFAMADTPEAAEQLVRKDCEVSGAKVKRVSAKLALEQDPTRYAFPEKILGHRPKTT